MADEILSVSAISSKKLEEYNQKAEVAVFKKALDQKGDIAELLIEGLDNTPAPGVGTRLNIVA